MQTFSYMRTGRTTRMLAAAYYEALKGETDPNAPTICVSFTTAWSSRTKISFFSRTLLSQRPQIIAQCS